MISRCAGGFERWVGFFMLLQVCYLKVSFKELLLNENRRMDVICVRQSGRPEVKVHFSGFEEWTIGEDGLIAQSDGNFDNDEYQHQLVHGIDF